MYYIHIVGKGEPTRGHETYDEAREEAERLSQLGSMNNRIIRIYSEFMTFKVVKTLEMYKEPKEEKTYLDGIEVINDWKIIDDKANSGADR